MTPFLFPVPVWNGRAPKVTSPWGPREGGHYSWHYGVDIFYPAKPEESNLSLPDVTGNKKWIVPSNTIPAMSIADGVVTKSSDIRTGGRVRVDHGDGLWSAYYHLSNRRVNVGDKVRQGQVVGTVGYDVSRGLHPNHLHFEIWKDKKQVDPAPYLRGAVVPPMPTPWGWLIAGGLAIVAGVYVVKKGII